MYSLGGLHLRRSLYLSERKQCCLVADTNCAAKARRPPLRPMGRAGTVAFIATSAGPLAFGGEALWLRGSSNLTVDESCTAATCEYCSISRVVSCSQGTRRTLPYPPACVHKVAVELPCVHTLLHRM